MSELGSWLPIDVGLESQRRTSEFGHIYLIDHVTLCDHSQAPLFSQVPLHYSFRQRPSRSHHV